MSVYYLYHTILGQIKDNRDTEKNVVLSGFAVTLAVYYVDL